MQGQFSRYLIGTLPKFFMLAFENFYRDFIILEYLHGMITQSSSLPSKALRTTIDWFRSLSQPLSA
jgi:hypothetical protein